MKWTIAKQESPAYFRVTLSGRLDLVGFDQMLGELVVAIKDAEWPPILLDERQRNVGQTTTERLEEAVNSLIVRNPAFAYCRIAILYNPGGDYERGREFKAIASPASYAAIEVFDNEANAMKWLLEQKSMSEP